MRAKEFIGESRARGRANYEFDQAHPGIVTPGGEGDVYWGRYYDFYRVSSLAGMDPEEISKVDDIGFFGNLPIFSAYTEYDRQKLKAIMKKLKMKPQDHVLPGSLEADYVNTTSPVQGFKGYSR